MGALKLGITQDNTYDSKSKINNKYRLVRAIMLGINQDNDLNLNLNINNKCRLVCAIMLGITQDNGNWPSSLLLFMTLKVYPFLLLIITILFMILVLVKKYYIIHRNATQTPSSLVSLVLLVQLVTWDLLSHRGFVSLWVSQESQKV